MLRTLICLILCEATGILGAQDLSTGQRPSPLQARSSIWRDAATDQAATPFDCRVDELPTSWGFKDSSIDIEQNSVSFTAIGTTWVDLYVRNAQSAPIDSLALVLEYRDKQGKVIDTVPIMGSTRKAEDALRLPFPLERVAPIWNGALSQGEAARVQGVKDGTRTSTCPVSAIVTFITVKFADGTQTSLWRDGWQLGPTPRVVPTLTYFPAGAVNPPTSVLTRVKIGTSGQVIDVVSKDHTSPKMLDSIRDEMMRDWTFNPALVDGQPVESELDVYFRIHADRSRTFEEPKSLSSPVTLIDFFPQKSKSDKWDVTYGSLLGGSGLR